MSSDAQPYASTEHRYDETKNPDGSYVAVWSTLLESINALSTEQRERRQRDIVRQFRANGLAHLPEHAVASGRRPWALDLVPLLFEEKAWENLATGLNQRARLHQALYQDIYGPQRLLKEGVMPPAMLYAHPAYLRDLVTPEQKLQSDVPLSMYTCDISRSPSGDWLVVDDVCQYPSGVGFALENRLVLSRVLPRTFVNYRVRRIAGYFRQLQQHLFDDAHPTTRCVMLSYSSTHPHYFEFAWLAKYLGYTLVEPADLTVRDNHVYLKTVAGLKSVETILRFMDDTYIDPLANGNTNEEGVAGLVEVARRGGVRVINPLGTGVLDNPAFNTILSELCEALLGESLLIHSPPTYWLGNGLQRDHVLSHIDQLLFRRIDSSSQLLDPVLLSESEKNLLLSEIYREPASYVAQERVDRSIAPSLLFNESSNRQITVRTYQVAKEGDYQLLPGGLCLLDDLAGGRRTTLEALTGSKDVWILSEQLVPRDTLLASPSDGVGFAMLEGELPSRIAENVFWYGRHGERVESTLRLLLVILQSMLDEEGSIESSFPHTYLQALLRALTAATNTYPGFLGRGGKRRLANPERELISLLQEKDRTGSLAAALQIWQGSADSIRDRLSGEMIRVWNRVDDLQSALQSLPLAAGFCSDTERLAETIDVLDELLQVTSACSGLVHENMTHGDGWLFMLLGRRVERAIQISKTVDTMLSVDKENSRLLEYLLRLFDSVMTYRSRYRSGLDIRLVVQLLLLDEINPRSLAYQFRHIDELINELPGRRSRSTVDPLRKLAVAGLSRVRLADPDALLSAGRDARQNFARFLKVLQELPTSMADAISAHYFTHTESRHRVGVTKSSDTLSTIAVDEKGTQT